MTRRLGPIALAVTIVAALAAPWVMDRYLVSLLSLAFSLGVLAMSLDLLVGYTGVVSLGHASIMAVSAYGVALVATNEGGYLLQIATGLGAALVVSIVFGLMVMRLSSVYFLLTTLAQGMTVWGLLFRLATVTGGENGLRGIRRPPAVEGYWPWYYATLVALLGCGLLMRIVVRSPLGLAVQGIRESESRMRSLGFNTTLCKFLIFVIAGFFAGVSGVLYVYYAEFISPDASTFSSSGKILLMTIFGGVGTLIGPVVGAVAIVLFEGFVSLYVERWPTLLGVLFVLVVLFARQGLAGLVASWRSRLSDFNRRRCTMSGKRVWRSGAVMAVALALAAAATTFGAGNEINIGFLAPMTGDAAALGKDMANGWKLFWKQHGSKLAGRTVTTHFQDDTGVPATALTKAQRFVNHDKVDLVVGTMHTNVGAAVGEFMSRTEIPFIGPTFTLDDHTQRKPIPGVMRIGGFSSSQDTHVMGDWAYKKGYRKVVTLCQDYVYGQEGCGGFARVFTDLGGQVVKQLWTPLGTQDYSPYISQIVEAKPDAVFVITVGGDVARFVQAARDFQLYRKVPIIGMDNLTDQTIMRNIDMSDLGLITVGHFAEGRNAPATQKFVEEYLKEFNELPSRYSSNVYTAAAWTAKALEEIKGDLSNRKAFLEALKRVKIPNTPQGPVSLDAYGNPVFNVYVRKVEKRPDGKLWNVPIQTYENVSQFFTYPAKEFLAKPVYSRNYQGDKVKK